MIIEDKIIDIWSTSKKCKRQLTKRDLITIYEDGTKVYRLWESDLVRQTVNGDIEIFIASANDCGNFYNYDYFYHPRREFIITNTTKSRLNTFLWYYGFNNLEVHSSKKDWSVKYNGKELKLDSWYKLNFNTKELEKSM